MDEPKPVSFENGLDGLLEQFQDKQIAFRNQLHFEDDVMVYLITELQGLGVNYTSMLQTIDDTELGVRKKAEASACPILVYKRNADFLFFNMAVGTMPTRDSQKERSAIYYRYASGLVESKSKSLSWVLLKLATHYDRYFGIVTEVCREVLPNVTEENKEIVPVFHDKQHETDYLLDQLSGENDPKKRAVLVARLKALRNN